MDGFERYSEINNISNQRHMDLYPPIAEPLATLRSVYHQAPVARIYGYLNSLERDQQTGLPLKRHFNPVPLARSLEWIALLDAIPVEDGSWRYVYRLVGEGVRAIYGRGAVDRPLEDVVPLCAIEHVVSVYNNVLSSGQPNFERSFASNTPGQHDILSFRWGLVKKDGSLQIVIGLCPVLLANHGGMRSRGLSYPHHLVGRLAIGF